MRTIHAKFASKCAETGVAILRNELCLYDPASKKVYALNSITAASHTPANVDPQADAYYDNFCLANNI
jgi:hypothetical protein